MIQPFTFIVLYFNYNYRYANVESNPVKFIEQIYSMERLIIDPTRVTVTTSTVTILDLIFTIMASKHRKPGVIPTGNLYLYDNHKGCNKETTPPAEM